MKKKLAVLLAFMMILSTMCSLNLVSAADPDADAPVYHLIAGPMDGVRNGANNEAAGQTLFEEGEWGDTYAGMFPLTVTLENMASGASGLIYVKYDKTKVTPIAGEMVPVVGEWESWKDAENTDENLFFKSAYSASSEIIDSGIDTEAGYIFMVWKGTPGPIDVNALKEAGYAAELGAFVFRTNEGVDVSEFDENTFVFDSEVVDEDTLYEQTRGYSPLILIANGQNAYGQSDSAVTREPMTVKFTYPNSEPTTDTFTVTFVDEDGETVRVITKKVGETVSVDDFPPVPEKPGYMGEWSVKEAITTTMTVEPVYTEIVDVPDPDAPVYHLIAGPMDGVRNGANNEAAGQTLFEEGEWGDTYAGMFPLTVTLENMASGASGLIYVKYDKTKVTPIAGEMVPVVGEWESWKDAENTDENLFFKSAYSASSEIIDSGIDTEAGYIFMVWKGTPGPIDVNALKEAGYAAELGAFVFRTNEGVDVSEFDENTFVFDSEVVDEDTLYEQTRGYSPLILIANGQNAYGQSDSAVTREPMTVKFTYPNSEPTTSDTFTVTFVADGKTVDTITKKVGETVSVSEFPDVPEKPGYTGRWEITTDITETTTVNAIYTPVATEDVQLDSIFTDGMQAFTFDPDTKTYEVTADPGYANYVIAGYANNDDVTITYNIDGGEYTAANVDNAYYFKLVRGQKSAVNIKLTDAEGEETIYTFNILIPGASNTVPRFETSGFELENYNPETRTYTVTPEEGHVYMRLWGYAAAEPDGDDQRTIEYAIGEATDTPEEMTYAPLAVGCDAREDNLFKDTPNFNENWRDVGFVNLWTEDGLSGKAMFVKVTGEGNPDAGYYTIIFE